MGTRFVKIDGMLRVGDLKNFDISIDPVRRRIGLAQEQANGRQGRPREWERVRRRQGDSSAAGFGGRTRKGRRQ